MKRPTTLPICSHILIILCGVTGFAAGSEFHYMPTPAPFTLALYTGVSADGSLAYSRINGSSDNPPPGYLWTAEGGFETFPPPEGLTNHRGFRDASSDGNVLLGTGTVSHFDWIEAKTYLWSREDGYRFLPKPEGALDVSGRLITEDGTTVVGFSKTADSNKYWKWNEREGYTFLPDDLGATNSNDVSPGFPQKLVNDGETLILRRAIHDFTKRETTFPPRPVPGRNPLIGDSTSDGRVIVGRAAVNERDSHAMRWEVGGEITNLGVLPGYPLHTDSSANAISADGKVILGYSYYDINEDMRAFVWDERSGMRELERVLQDDYGMDDLHPWGLGTATGISDDRRTVVGSIREGRRPKGSPGDMWVAQLDWPLGSIRSDFDLDGALDDDDANLLVNAILSNSTDPLYDLDANNLVELSDLDNLLARAGRHNGDANFDGAVNFADFLLLSSSFGEPGLWSEGDFDANGEVAFADFLILSGNFGMSVAVTSVPEPTSSTTGALVLCFGLLFTRRSRSGSKNAT